jgi:hypothetical protein
MIDSAVLYFFSDELQKEAGVGDAARWVGGHIGNAARWAGEGIANTPREVRDSVVGMAKHPVDSLRTGWASTPGWGRALVGVMGAGQAHDAIKNPETGGMGRGERVGRLVGGTFTGIAGTTASGGVLPGMITGMAGDAIGGAVGRGVDKGVARLRGTPRLPPVQPPPPVQG